MPGLVRSSFLNSQVKGVSTGTDTSSPALVGAVIKASMGLEPHRKHASPG